MYTYAGAKVLDSHAACTALNSLGFLAKLHQEEGCQAERLGAAWGHCSKENPLCFQVLLLLTTSPWVNGKVQSFYHVHGHCAAASCLRSHACAHAQHGTL